MKGTVIKTNVVMGQTYRDINTGFEGVAVCVGKWQYGCVRITLQPKIGEDGKLPDIQAFDEESLEGVKPIQKATGGPSPDISPVREFCNGRR